MLAFALLALAVSSAQSLTEGEEEKSLESNPHIDLRCIGSGTHKVTESRIVTVTNTDGGWNNTSNTVHETRDQSYAGSVMVSVRGDQGRILLPYQIHEPKQDDEKEELELQSLLVGDDKFTATARISRFNNASVNIDRFTGEISISLSGASFNGVCEKYDPADVKRKF